MFEHDNGNGSLMRTLPLAFYLESETDITKRYQVIKEVSSITHAHFRSVFACFIYVEYAILLLQGQNKLEAYKNMSVAVSEFAHKMEFNPAEIELFKRVLKEDISTYNEETIESTGYVLHSLEASFWCLLTTENYSDTVLKAVKLGGDTDTTATITGGLAGICYGYDEIPKKWLSQLARFDDIEELIERFNTSLQ